MNMASTIAVFAPLLNGMFLLLTVYAAVNSKDSHSDCDEPDKVDMFEDLCVSEKGDKTPVASYFGKYIIKAKCLSQWYIS